VAQQFIKFGITGSIGAMVDFGSYTLLTRLIGWNHIYRVAGLEVSTANNISVFLAIMSNFLFNKYWTFRYNRGSFMQQWAGYFAFNFVTWMVNQVLVSYFTFRSALFHSLFGDQKDLVAKVVAIALILTFNFLGSKLLIFRHS
jgi:dolichol-phosphate mannosyltransferase